MTVVSFPDFTLVEHRFFEKVRNEQNREKKVKRKGNGTTKDKDANNIVNETKRTMTTLAIEQAIFLSKRHGPLLYGQTRSYVSIESLKFSRSDVPRETKR